MGVVTVRVVTVGVLAEGVLEAGTACAANRSANIRSDSRSLNGLNSTFTSQGCIYNKNEQVVSFLINDSSIAVTLLFVYTGFHRKAY